MNGEKGWTIDDIMKRRIKVMLTSRGVATDQTGKGELVVDNGYQVKRIDPYESVMWYGLTFDALELTECFDRYNRSLCQLGLSPKRPEEVIVGLISERYLCVGIEKDRFDAVFSMFCTGFIFRAIEQNEYLRPEKRVQMYYDRYLHWEGVERSPRLTDPLTEDEKKVMAMLAAENWSAAELVRNFVKGFDTSMKRIQVPREKFPILSMDPDEDLVRLNYERNPMARSMAKILLNLLRSRKILLY